MKLPDETIGWINMIDGIESADRVSAAAKAAVESIGWKFIHCDGKGDPTVMNACGSSLLAQGVTGIILNGGIEASTVAVPLAKAQKQGVPVISLFASSAPSPLLAGRYYADEKKLGELATTYVMDQLSKPGTSQTVAIQDFPATFATDRTDRLREAIAGKDVKIVADLVADNANLVAGTRQQVDATLTQNPKLGAFWFAFDTSGQAGGQAIQARYPGKSVPDRPLVATFHADQSTSELMRTGAIDVAADVNYDAPAWVGVDQLAQFFARGTAMSPDPEPVYPVDYLEYRIIAKDNIPAKGRLSVPKDDFIAFFTGKWAAEFGVDAK